MSTTSARDKVNALMWLAAGKPLRVAAESANVSPSTVSGWKRQPVFAAELEAVKAVYARKPLDGRELLARLQEAERRLSPGAAEVGAGGRFQVQVVIPPGTSPRKRERLMARALAKGIAAASRERP